MKNTLFYTAVTVFLAGCSAVDTLPNKDSGVINLTHSKEEAEKYWVASRLVTPKYPVSVAKNKIAGCSRFQITIDSMGNTVNSVLLESYPTKAFVTPSKAALRNWTWEPTSYNHSKAPIIRNVQLDFYIENAQNYEQAKEHCSV